MNGYVEFINFKNYLEIFFQTINNLCEVAIQVKQEDLVIQIWDIETFEWKFNAMKDIYQTWKTSENPVKIFFLQK